MDEIGPIELGSFPLIVYAALFGGTVIGQFAGMAIDASLGRRLLWVPVVCSVVLESIAGARFGTRGGRVVSMGDWGRLSGYYSLCLAALSLPLAGWTAASRTPQSPFGGHDPSGIVLVALGVLAVATVVRWGLMTALSGRRA